jgi:hypothetical protein
MNGTARDAAGYFKVRLITQCLLGITKQKPETSGSSEEDLNQILPPYSFTSIASTITRKLHDAILLGNLIFAQTVKKF